MQDRDPLNNPQPGDMVEAIVDGEHIVYLVTMIIAEDVQPVTFDMFKNGQLFPHRKSSVYYWQEWCRIHNATVKVD